MKQLARYGVVFMLLAVCALGHAQATQTDVTVTIAGASAPAGTVAELPVSITTRGTAAPTGLLLILSYDNTKTSPALRYFEVAPWTPEGLPVVDAAGNVAAKHLAVRLDDALRKAGFSADVTDHAESGKISIMIRSANDAVGITNGPLLTLAMNVPADAVSGALTPVGGVPTDTPITLEGSQVSSNAASTGLVTAMTVGFLQGNVGATVCATALEEEPSCVTLTDTYPDAVRVGWLGVPGEGITYRVYRQESGQQWLPLGDGWSEATNFVDVTAKAPVPDTTAGCPLLPDVITTRYDYKVVARAADGCLSEEENGGSGCRNIPQGASRADNMLDVIPGVNKGGTAQLIDLNSTLVIRLESNDIIDPNSVWAETMGSTLLSKGVTWVPTVPGADGSETGWAVVRLTTPWPAGKMITVRAGASNLDKTPIPTVVRQFVTKPQAANGPTGMVQAVEDFNSPATLLAEGVGSVYRMLPEGVYTEPVAVSLPVPDGENPDDMEIYFFNETQGDGQWYLGRNVTDWLGDEGTVTTDANGKSSIKFTVRHSALVQLGRPLGSEVQSASMLPRPLDVAGLMVFAVLALALTAFRRLWTAAR